MPGAYLHASIGPVQSFIAEARRARDLWAGSFLLCWLTAQATLAVRASGGTLVYPTSDPMIDFMASGAAGAGPFVGSLPNQFLAQYSASDAAEKGLADARQAIAANWKKLADAVWEEFVDPINPSDAQRKIWERQIGDGTWEGTAFWEVTSVVVAEEKGDRGALMPNTAFRLDRAKHSRLPPPALMTPGYSGESGNMCSLMGHWQELSGETRSNPQSNDRRKIFWQKIARQINKRTNVPPDAECLNLRPGESLCSTALVKRLFPLLPTDRLAAAIGWVPVHRAVGGRKGDDTDARGFAERAKVQQSKFRNFVERLRALYTRLDNPTPAQPIGGNVSVMLGATQERRYWPSTSYVAAANWLEHAQHVAPDLALEFAESLRKSSYPLSVAERSVQMKGVSPGGPLAALDGAALFSSTIEKMTADGAIDDGTVLSGLLKEIAKMDKVGSSAEAPTKLGGPSNYFAVVRFDGDNAGRCLREVPGFAAALDAFSALVRGVPNKDDSAQQVGVVGDANGVLLYAGGDDVLALCPVEDALPAAIALRCRYAECMGDNAASATASAAVLFADRRTPLRWVMQESNRLLTSVAKDGNGRDSLATGLIESGGYRTTWATTWGNDCENAARLQQLGMRAGTTDEVLRGNRLYHDLGTVLAPFRGDDNWTYEDYLSDLHDAARTYVALNDSQRAQLTSLVAGYAKKDQIAGELLNVFALRVRGRDGRDPSATTEIGDRLCWPALTFIRFLGREWRKMAA